MFGIRARGMLSYVPNRFVTLAGLSTMLAALSGCSADSVTPPEPVIERPGSFVAVTDPDGVILLLRTLRVVPIDSRESLYEAIQYRGQPSSYDEARTMAKDPDLPVADPHSGFSFQGILTLAPEVVWFRTLSQAELDALF